MTEPLRILCFGDVVGRPGRELCRSALSVLRASQRADLVIVNAENASGGLGIDADSAREIKQAGADVLTLGDHTWQRKEVRDFIEHNADWCIRPANYPPGAPGKGWTIVTLRGTIKVGIFNLLGRVFINAPLDCPFRCAADLVSGPLSECTVRILDMHAEATSEKVAMGRYLDGKLALQVGTHTHVATADEQVLPGGTGYITDLGMSGCQSGVIGMDTETALGRLMSGLPAAYKVATGPAFLSGVLCEISAESGKAISVRRVVAREDGSLV